MTEQVIDIRDRIEKMRNQKYATTPDKPRDVGLGVQVARRRMNGQICP